MRALIDAEIAEVYGDCAQDRERPQRHYRLNANLKFLLLGGVDSAERCAAACSSTPTAVLRGSAAPREMLSLLLLLLQLQLLLLL